MKQCTSCGQIIAQKITTCPACGSHLVAGMKSIDDYKIKSRKSSMKAVPPLYAGLLKKTARHR